jgi:SAM-dependent methyltransferase
MNNDVAWGDLRRLHPISAVWGFDRGRPLDRYYIEAFLARHAPDVQGHVLEIGDDAYTRRFGHNNVTRSDVLHIAEGNPQATIVGDLAQGEHIPSDAFDCIILTQTLQLIYDVRAALLTVFRILKPGGVLLATVPGISQVDEGEWGATWCWSFTPYALERLMREACPEAEVAVEAHGNVLAAMAFLQGLADHELRVDELDHHDPAYPLLVTARATKPASNGAGSRPG